MTPPRCQKFYQRAFDLSGGYSMQPSFSNQFATNWLAPEAYQSVGDTKVQLFVPQTSGVMPLRQPIQSDCGQQEHEETTQAERQGIPMNSDGSFDRSTCADGIQLAERELASFIGAVTELFGPEQARLSAEDWLDEFESMHSPLRSAGRDWRSVTAAASALLASRLTVARGRSALAA